MKPQTEIILRWMAFLAVAAEGLSPSLRGAAAGFAIALGLARPVNAGIVEEDVDRLVADLANEAVDLAHLCRRLGLHARHHLTQNQGAAHADAVDTSDQTREAGPGDEFNHEIIRRPEKGQRYGTKVPGLAHT